MNLKRITVFISICLALCSFTSLVSAGITNEDDESYSVFEIMRIKRSMLNEEGLYTIDDYNILADFLLKKENNSKYYNVTYDYEGCDTSGYKDPSVLDTQEHKEGTTIKVLNANLYKDGYIHAGWEYDGVVYSGGDVFKTPSCDVIFTPIWYKRCMLTYLAGNVDNINGSTSTYVMATANTKAFLADSSRFSRSGYTLSGWTCSYDGKYYTAGEQFPVPECDVSFTAVWTPAVYDFTFNASNGNSADKFILKGTYNEQLIMPDCDFTKIGYKFVGWKFNNGIYQPGEEITVPSLLPGLKFTVSATWELV